MRVPKLHISLCCILALLSILTIVGKKAQAQGNVGNSLVFDNASYVNLGQFDCSGNQLTVELLFKSTGPNTSVTSFVGQAASNQNIFDLQISRFRIGAVQISNGISSTQLDDGRWHHVAGVYDGQFIYYYVDGCLLASQPYMGGVSTAAIMLTIGVSFQSIDFLNGIVDEVRIWREARSNEQLIDNFYDLPNFQSEANLLAYFKFENSLASEVGTLNGNMVGSLSYANSGLVEIDSDKPITITHLSCVNSNDGSVSIVGSNSNLQTSLDNGVYSGKFTYTNLSAGPHILRIRTIYGCVFDHPFVINNVPNAGLLAVANPNPVCNGQSLQLASRIDGDSTLVSFTWSGPANYSSNQQIPVPILSTNSTKLGNYIVTATYNNCVVKDTVLVSGGNNPPTPDAGPDQALCENVPAIFNGTAPGSIVAYAWTGPNGFTANTLSFSIPSSTLLNEGNYILVTSDGGCLSDPDTTFLNVNAAPNPQLGNDTILCPGDPFLLEPGDFNSYLWSTGSSSSSIIVQDPDVYWVEVSDEIGCRGSDTLQLIFFCSTEVYFPNAFTPDGDGYNDVFLLTVNNVVKFNMEIYNRWGEMVFNSKDQYVGWDGTYNGELVKSDIYNLKAKISVRDAYDNVSDIDVVGKLNVLR